MDVDKSIYSDRDGSSTNRNNFITNASRSHREYQNEKPPGPHRASGKEGLDALPTQESYSCRWSFKSGASTPRRHCSCLTLLTKSVIHHWQQWSFTMVVIFSTTKKDPSGRAPRSDQSFQYPDDDDEVTAR